VRAPGRSVTPPRPAVDRSAPPATSRRCSTGRTCAGWGCRTRTTSSGPTTSSTPVACSATGGVCRWRRPWSSIAPPPSATPSPGPVPASSTTCATGSGRSCAPTRSARWRNSCTGERRGSAGCGCCCGIAADCSPSACAGWPQRCGAGRGPPTWSSRPTATRRRTSARSSGWPGGDLRGLLEDGGAAPRVHGAQSAVAGGRRARLGPAVRRAEQGEFGPARVLRHEAHRGVAAALQDGLEASPHDLVARVDADDICRPERFAQQIPRMDEDGLDLLGSSMREFSDAVPPGTGPLRTRPLEHEQIVRYLPHHSPFHHPTVVLRRSVALAVGGYRDLALLEDYWLW